jgi:Ca2+-dependent lipid-binding protein
MPSLVKIKVVSARDLNEKETKKKGKAEAFTDSFVNITLGNQEQQRTHTIKKTSNPVWVSACVRVCACVCVCVQFVCVQCACAVCVCVCVYRRLSE